MEAIQVTGCRDSFVLTYSMYLVMLPGNPGSHATRVGSKGRAMARAYLACTPRMRRYLLGISPRLSFSVVAFFIRIAFLFSSAAVVAVV